MDPFNLIREDWIPVRLRSGETARVAPWRLTGPDPPVDIDTPRPDFKGALLEFLVGLVQTALPPRNVRAWRDGFDTPPSPETLRAALEPLAPYFNLFGQRPLFLQDLTLNESEVKDPKPVAALLMDSPGENSFTHNGDFFIKRDHPPDRLCPACAAAALFTLQAYAPAGGAGFRVSLRGGGPLTTLVIGQTTWETVWSNILPQNHRDVAALPDPAGIPDAVFAWAAPTHDSTDGSELHFQHLHFLHHYWGMPRRIVLLPETDAADSDCPVCGAIGRLWTRRFLTKNYGNNYGDGWRHPLTPHRDQGPGKEPLTLKGVSEGRNYSHWLGLVYGDSPEGKFPVRPALAARAFQEAKPNGQGQIARLRAYGFDMDNMKARNWCEGEFPVYGLEGRDLAAVVQEIGRLVAAADLAKRNLASAVKEALFSDGARGAKPDASLLNTVAARFWAETERAFYARTQAAIRDLDNLESLIQNRENWLVRLVGTTLSIFAAVAERGGVPARKAEQIYGARNRMRAYTATGCAKILNLPRKKKGGDA